jgi:hypothetical protein
MGGFECRHADVLMKFRQNCKTMIKKKKKQKKQNKRKSFFFWLDIETETKINKKLQEEK